MNDIQETLRQMNLESASEYITDRLIDYVASLKSKTEDLAKRREDAQEKYNLHNDGDASENAPLEEAIKVLKKVANEQYKLEVMKRRLASIEDAKYRQSTMDQNLLRLAYGALTEDDKQIISRECNIFDLSYESLESNIKEISNLDVVGGSKTLVSFVSLCDQFNKIAKLPLYNPCGIVLLYTTVRLKLLYKNEEKILTYKIYPEGVSILDIGIIAKNCKVAKSILNKTVGYKFTINTPSAEVSDAEYEILDIY